MPFSHFLRNLFVLSAISLLTSCLTYPHPRDEVVLSPVSDVLLNDGRLWSGQLLSMNRLSDHKEDMCAEPIAEASTDETGRFEFKEVREARFLRTVILAPSSPTYRMTLCHRKAGTVDVIVDATIWATLPRHLELSCSSMTTGTTLCEVQDWSGYNFIKGHPGYGTQRSDAERNSKS